jgi:putative ABC transport system permease protein
MRQRTLVARSLVHYRAAHLAVVLGVATAAAVLGGALVVGDSVRDSLGRTALERLGRTTHAIESPRFFREDLARDLVARPGFRSAFDGACPIVALRGAVTAATTGRRAGDVQVYGVDERFWAFQALEAPVLGPGRDAVVSEALAAELGSTAGDAILVRLEATADIPASSLFGRRDDPSRALRLTLRGVLPRASLGELSLRPRTTPVRAAFVPLSVLQRALGREGRVNVVLASAREGDVTDAALSTELASVLSLDDLGLRLRSVPAVRALQLETAGGLVDETLARRATGVARSQGLRVNEVLVYLANTISSGAHEVPYSLVAALDPEALAAVAGRPVPVGDGEALPIVLDEWAAARLHAAPGSRVTLGFFLWHEEGRLDTARADFRIAAITPMAGLAADRDLVPDYPGITESLHLADWDPPFPVDLDRIRPEDEAYWDRYRATPKAFVPLAVGQRLWGHRQGRLTSLRLTPPSGTGLESARQRFGEGLLAEVGRGDAGTGAAWGPPAVAPVRRAALEASRGSTDFGLYFAYFSFFLVLAGLLLAGLFFRLGLEQRLREVGLLEAVGFAAARLRRHYQAEGLALAVVGGVLGALLAPGYAALVLWGLRTLWADALGTRDLELSLRVSSPLVGALGAILAAGLAIAWTLRDLRRQSPRALLAGSLEPWTAPPARRRFGVALALALAAVAVATTARLGLLPDTAGFFGAGSLLLVAALLLARQLLAWRSRSALALRGISGLGLRGLSYRPGRSVLCIALVAAATFVIVAVGAFRHEGVKDVASRSGESGGYRLFAWSLAALHHDLTSAEGQAALGLPPGDLEGIDVARFRARRGDDASCLNLYAPREPTVLAARPSFLRQGRFSFQSSLAATDAERANPWLLLERERKPDEPIPVAADASTLAYALHRKLGDEMPLGGTGTRVRFVAALAPGVLQGELVMGERSFLEAFPSETGDRFFLLDAPAERVDALTASLESHLADLGFDVGTTASRLRELHRVENTYIATFQALGALGLLLGSVGLATVLVRNALEQRGELALLRAVGFRSRHLTRMTLAQNAALVGLGFLAGAGPALVAVAPMLLDRRGVLPLTLTLALLLALAATGLLVSWLAVAFVRRLPLVASLRSE